MWVGQVYQRGQYETEGECIVDGWCAHAWIGIHEDSSKSSVKRQCQNQRKVIWQIIHIHSTLETQKKKKA